MVGNWRTTQADVPKEKEKLVLKEEQKTRRRRKRRKKISRSYEICF